MCDTHQPPQEFRPILPEQSLQPLTSLQKPGRAARCGIGLVRFYQKRLSPLTPDACRFYPSCSQYTLIAIARYGLLKGCWMGMGRILRCQPFTPGGYDPVP